MPFIMPNGRVLSKRDSENIKKMLKEIMDGYLVSFREDYEYASAKGKQVYDEVFVIYQESSDKLMQEFESSAASEENVRFDTFLSRGLSEALNPVLSIAAKNTQVAETFKSGIVKNFQSCFNSKSADQNTLEGLKASMKSFSLTEEPFPGIDAIVPFDPNSNSAKALIPALKGNSTTLSADSPEAGKDEFSFRSGVELTGIHASELMNSREVGFSDIYEMFSSINSAVRLGDENGGRLRSTDINAENAAGKLYGPAPMILPVQMHEFCSTVAENINKIKQTQDQLLRKSQAVQLAAFTYQIAVSEHIFSDGNGRSSRLLADTILQTFGMPPHTPHIALVGTGATLGQPLDFRKGAKLVLEGVKMSSELLQAAQKAKPAGKELPGREYVMKEHIGPMAAEKMTNDEAVGFAVQLRGNKLGFAEALDDLIYADHFGSRNSKQYDALIEKAKALKENLTADAVHSVGVQNAVREMKEAMKEYKAHCQRHPHSDRTRAARLTAVANLDDAVYSIEKTAGKVNELEKPLIDETVGKRQESVMEAARLGNLTKAGLADYLYTSWLKHGVDNFGKEYGFSTLAAAAGLGYDIEETGIAEDPAVMKAMLRTVGDIGLSHITSEEQLKKIAEKYVALKDNEYLASLRKQSGAKEQPGIDKDARAAMAQAAGYKLPDWKLVDNMTAARMELSRKQQMLVRLVSDVAVIRDENGDDLGRHETDLLSYFADQSANGTNMADNAAGSLEKIEQMGTDYLRDHAEEIAKACRGLDNDRKLVEGWPKLDLVLSCYDEVFRGSTDPKIKAVVDMHGELTERMKTLAADGKTVRVRNPRPDLMPEARRAFIESAEAKRMNSALEKQMKACGFRLDLRQTVFFMLISESNAENDKNLIAGRRLAETTIPKIEAAGKMKDATPEDIAAKKKATDEVVSAFDRIADYGTGYLKAHAKEFDAQLRADISDDELLDVWPKLDIVLTCYQEAFDPVNGSAAGNTSDKHIQGILGKTAVLRNRMNALAIDNENLAAENDAPENEQKQLGM